MSSEGCAAVEIVGGRKFVEISGDRTHELPPLLVNATPGLRRLDKIVDLAARIVDSEDILAPASRELASVDAELERRRMDLSLQLAEEYRGLLTDWKWGDSILEWIRQCEITFESRLELRNLLHPDLWPHAGRSSFVKLLEDKSVSSGGVDFQKAVGLRITFRQPAADLVLFGPVSFLSQGHDCLDCVPDVGPDDPRAARVPTT